MGKPNESFDDYVVERARGETTPEPSGGGARELAADPGAIEDGEVSEPAGNTFLSWVHRLVAVGSVLAMIAIILLGALSALRVVIGERASERNAMTNEQPSEDPEATTNVGHSDGPETTNGQYPDEAEPVTNGQYADEAEAPTDGPEAAAGELMTNGEPPDEQPPTKEPLSIFSAPSPARVNMRRSKARPRRARPRMRFAGYKPRRSLPWRPQPLESLFMPTTLVIYVDNGVIKTRIEPWPRSTPTPNN